MVYSLFLQCISACRQPQHSFPVIFRNCLIGICRLAIAAGNLYIDAGILDLRVFIQVIDCQLHAIQRIVVFVCRTPIRQVAAGRNEIHVCIGVCNFQCAGSTIEIGLCLCASRTAVAAGTCRSAVISLCIIAIPVTIILIGPTIGSALCVPEICVGTVFTIRLCSITLCTGCADTAAAKASIAIRLDLAASDS